jgi:diguanylate cyclase (GGDEF)-like protein/PAS domain S-box-containing protein
MDRERLKELPQVPIYPHVSDEAAPGPDLVLASLLVKPDVVFAALASDGTLLPMPASVPVAADRVLEAPGDRANMLDVVVPQDSMTVVTTWERAREHGVALATVRTRTHPDEALTLTFLDARREHGVYLGALDVVEADDDDRSAQALQAVTVSRRPRTATARKSAFAVITDIDERTTRMLGWTREQMVGQRSSEFIHPDDQERAIANWMELLSRQDAQRVRLRHRRADGSWVWLELENQYEAADDPADAVVVTQMSDISDEMAAHEALQQRERLLRRVAESLPVGILQLGTDGGVLYANSRLSAILGLAGVSDVADLVGAVRETDRRRLQDALTATLQGHTEAELEVEVGPGNGGDLRVAAISLVSLGDREGAPGALVSVTDVTDSARMREELTAKATFDVLTGCHNRAATMAFIEQALRDTSESTAVLFVDLDNFKPVNDTLGHGAGDELLVLTADRLNGVLRRNDIVGRIGGDEFLIVSRGLRSHDAALAMGERVREALSSPVVLSAGPVSLCASIGVACAEDGDDVASLIRRADEAMYRSKQDGRGRPVMRAG